MIIRLLVLLFFGNAIWGQQQILSFSWKYANPYPTVIRHHESDRLDNGLASFVQIRLGSFYFVNEMLASSDSLNTLRGGGKKVKGFYGYTRQGYLRWDRTGSVLQQNVIVGRAPLSVGYGKGAHLFISDWSRPFDQARWSMTYRDFSSMMAAIQLEDIGSDNRWLTVHTLKWSWREKISLTFGESALFSGAHRTLEWQYFNPLLFWIPEQENPTTGPANFLLFAGGEYHVYPKWRIWCEFLLDDFQINHQSKGDLEPNEFGVLAGGEYQGENIQGWLEYSAVTNRTYQTPAPSEIYSHRGFPIGHYLGNDFDLWQGHIQLPIPNYQLRGVQTILWYTDVGYLRDGANGLDTPFDTPWMDSTITLESGYSEPFPTKPITYITELETGLEIRFTNDSFITFGYFWQRKETQGQVKIHSRLALRLWVELKKTFRY